MFTELKTRLFGTARSKTIIVGTNTLTRLLANELDASGRTVSLIDLESAMGNGNSRDDLVLAGAGAKAASCVLASTPNDGQNLRLCLAARLRFQVPMVIARLGLLGGVPSWARLSSSGMVRMTCTDLVPTILGNVTPSNELARVAGATDREHVADVELLTPVFVGRTAADLALSGCELLALRRNDLWVDAFDRAELRRGDVLTLIGTQAAINKVRESFLSI